MGEGRERVSAQPTGGRRHHSMSVPCTLSSKKVICSPMQLKHNRAGPEPWESFLAMHLQLKCIEVHLSSEEKLVNHNSMCVMLPNEKPYPQSSLGLAIWLDPDESLCVITNGHVQLPKESPCRNALRSSGSLHRRCKGPVYSLSLKTVLYQDLESPRSMIPAFVPQ